MKQKTVTVIRSTFVAVLLVLACMAAFSNLSGCAAGHPKPQNVGQAIVDGKGVLEKATIVTTRLLQADLITVEQAIDYRGKILDTWAALDAAEVALEVGDTSTAIGKLQAAQTVLDFMARLSTQPGAQP